nr:MAG TPA: hypothetical protein [Caudoviricetes sp.]
MAYSFNCESLPSSQTAHKACVRQLAVFLASPT